MSLTNTSRLIVPIGSIVLGILFIIFPNTIFDIIFYIVGAVILLFGLYSLVVNIINFKKNPETNKVLIIIDVIIMLLGILFVSLAHIFIVLFLIILGISFLLFGIYGIYASVVDQSISKALKIVNSTIYCLNFIIGITLLFNLDRSTEWVMYFLGSILLVNGLLLSSTFIKSVYNEKHKKIHSKQTIDKEVIDVEVIEK